MLFQFTTFLQFKQDRVILPTNPKFVPKVPSDFHLNEPIVLRTFFPNPQTAAERALHSLDLKRCLKFYLDRTKTFRKSNQLFVAYSRPRKGLPLTKQSISQMDLWSDYFLSPASRSTLAFETIPLGQFLRPWHSLQVCLSQTFAERQRGRRRIHLLSITVWILNS